MYGGHFAKILRVFGRKLILIYFNNETELMKALLDSGMKDELGQGLKIKSQNELIGKDGKFISRLSRRRRSSNKFSSDGGDSDLFFDAEGELSNVQTIVGADSSSKTQDSSGFVENFNKLNEDFSK
jgi:hypothetical protein